MPSTALAPSPAPEEKAPPRITRAAARDAAIVAALLGLFATLALVSMRSKGLSFDECAHIPAGVSYLLTGDFRMTPDHPPLAKEIAALPLVATGVRFSTDWPEWKRGLPWPFGFRFLHRENRLEDVLARARPPIVAIGCLLGLLVWLWARRLGGPLAGHAALFLYALSPDFIAHSQIVTTDVPLAAFVLAAAFFLRRALAVFSVRDAALAGLALGAALATKFSAVVFIPAFAVGIIARAIAGRAAARAAVIAAMLIACSLCAIWASYGGGGGEPIGPGGRTLFDWEAVSTDSLAARAMLYARDIGILPDAYVYGFLFVLKTAVRSSFLLGEYSAEGGWPHYFLVTFALKTPLPAILAILGALALLPLRLARREDAAERAALLLPALLYLGVALATTLNIGHRHILPIYPFLFVLAGAEVGRVLAGAGARTWLARAAAAGLAGWLAVGTIAVHPHYLAYFNEVAGGPENGWRHLVDSNLEWGQDLPALKRWMDENGVKKLFLSYFGASSPEYYGIDYEPLPSHFPLHRPMRRGVAPRAGDLIAVSATNLQGVYLQTYPAFLPLLQDLRERHRPIAVIAHSIFVFRYLGPPPAAR